MIEEGVLNSAILRKLESNSIDNGMLGRVLNRLDEVKLGVLKIVVKLDYENDMVTWSTSSTEWRRCPSERYGEGRLREELAAIRLNKLTHEDGEEGASRVPARGSYAASACRPV